MKKILLACMLFISLVNANEVLKSIANNILKPEVNQTITSLENLKKTHSKDDFFKFIKKWKELEATYVAGDIDESLIDHPRLIDVYHNMNEDIKVQLLRIVDSNDDYSYALFKNSHKSVNALEYLIFTQDKLPKKRKDEAIDLVIDNIFLKLNDIKDVYTNNITNFIDNKDGWSYSVVSNSLISSIYKLKEWRIGEPSGLVSKYENNPNNERAEYFLSKASLVAIDGKLNAHIKLFTKQPFKNMYSYSVEKGFEKEANSIQEGILKAKEILKEIKTEDFTQPKIKELYDVLNNLQKEYQMLLILSLEIPMKIIEADGD